MVMAADTVDDPGSGAAWGLLSSRAILEPVEALGDYSTEESDRRVR
jgi:hypothetical protein